MTIEKNKLIEFTNLVNECCTIMDHDYGEDWLTKPNPDLNMDTPLDAFNQEGMDRILRLLYFIDIGEADL
ncbi:MAG: MbcA/ParS/Xre antitoxin family protein [Nisaea sp.]|nr:MbcA/ParS/Xre antitoxin family protein [Nisaea sp.]